MAIERALIRESGTQAPKDATCYICLEGEGGRKLMRGCACRGDSAGFVHLECLAELATRKESDDPQTAFNSWSTCGTCRQTLVGGLGLLMARRFWRRHRSGDERRCYNAAKALANCLDVCGELDAASHLDEEASKAIGNHHGLLLYTKLRWADGLSRNGKKLEALELLKAMLPETKYTLNHELYLQTMLKIPIVLLELQWFQEAHDTAADLVAFAKTHYGSEDQRTLTPMKMYAMTSAHLGRVHESKTIFDDVLTVQTRIYGRDHPLTLGTRQRLKDYGFLDG